MGNVGQDSGSGYGGLDQQIRDHEERLAELKARKAARDAAESERNRIELLVKENLERLAQGDGQEAVEALKALLAMNGLH